MRGEADPRPPDLALRQRPAHGQRLTWNRCWTPLLAHGSTTTRRGRRRSVKRDALPDGRPHPRAARRAGTWRCSSATEEPMPFQEDDLLLAEELVTRAALCLDNARQYAREHTAALDAPTQPAPPPLWEAARAVEVASRYLPADMDHGVGGDWFDVIQLSGARVALVVGDVVGHGINAAATMGRLRTAVRTLADMELPPDELLAHLDDTVRRLRRGRRRRSRTRHPAVGGRHLSVRRLRPGHPAVHDGAGRAPPARDHRPAGPVSLSPTCPPGPRSASASAGPLRVRGAGTARGDSARPLHRRSGRDPRPTTSTWDCDRLGAALAGPVGPWKTCALR